MGFAVRSSILLVGGIPTPLKKYESVGMILPNIWENKKRSKPPTSLDSQVVLPFLSTVALGTNPILSLCLGVNGSNRKYRKCVTLEKGDPTSKLHMVEELQVIHPVKTLDLLEADQHATVASSRRKRLASEHPACVKSCGLPEIAAQKNLNSLSILYDLVRFTTVSEQQHVFSDVPCFNSYADLYKSEQKRHVVQPVHSKQVIS